MRLCRRVLQSQQAAAMLPTTSLPPSCWATRCSAVQRSGVAVLATVGVVGAWTVRNVIRMDQVVLISTNTGDNLCIGHSDHARSDR